MPTLEEFAKWVEDQGGPGDLAAKIKERFGQKIKISQSAVSNWVSRGRVSEEKIPYLKEMGWLGPYEWEKPVPVTGALPEHIAEAWAIVHEAARSGGADIMALDVAAVGEILSTAAEVAAAGRGEEARQRAVRKAETILKAMGRDAP